MRQPGNPRIDAPGPECFTAEPSVESARIVHLSYKNILRSHFLSALESAEEGLETDLSHIAERFRRLDVRQRFSPAIYVALTNLSESLRSGNVTTVMDSLQEIRVTPDARFLDASFRMDSILTESWEKSFIEKVRNEPIEGVEEDATVLRPILDPDLSNQLVGTDEALDLLLEVDPDLSAVFYELVTRVKLLVGRGYFGFSSPEAFGAIFIRLPDANPTEYFLEHLVRELSHLNLNAIMAHDPLLENPMHQHAAPLRRDPRPLFQILHATFVLSRNVRVSRRVVEIRPELGYEPGLEAFEEKYAQGYQTVQQEAKLTDLGRRLFESMEPVER